MPAPNGGLERPVTAAIGQSAPLPFWVAHIAFALGAPHIGAIQVDAMLPWNRAVLPIDGLLDAFDPCSALDRLFRQAAPDLKASQWCTVLGVLLQKIPQLIFFQFLDCEQQGPDHLEVFPLQACEQVRIVLTGQMPSPGFPNLMVIEGHLDLLRDMEGQVLEAIEESSLPADLPRTDSGERRNPLSSVNVVHTDGKAKPLVPLVLACGSSSGLLTLPSPFSNKGAHSSLDLVEDGLRHAWIPVEGCPWRGRAETCNAKSSERK